MQCIVSWAYIDRAHAVRVHAVVYDSQPCALVLIRMCGMLGIVHVEEIKLYIMKTSTRVICLTDV